MTILDTFEPLFFPRTIAVVGASATSISGGNRFIRHLRNYGYDGQIWPIHPTANEVEGLPAWPSFAALPGVADYAYVAVGASAVARVLREARGRLKIAQVMSSGFGETEDGDAIQEDLVAAARKSAIRVVGPNCLGIHSPRGRVTFTELPDPTPGGVGVISQSGGLGVDIIRRGKSRGLRYSGVVTVGNCADVRPHELLDYYLQSPETQVIGLYLESARGGRQLFERLRAARGAKPVVLLRGGSTQEGQGAAASHTGALAGSDAAWTALCEQTGVVAVETLDAFLDTLVAFQCLQPGPRPFESVALFGNGGGASVLGTDAFARRGIPLTRLAPDTLAFLEALNLPPGSSVRNPVDVPAGSLQEGEGRVAGRIIEALTHDPRAAVVIHINMTVVLSFRHIDLLGNLMRSVLAVKQARANAGGQMALVLRSDGEPEVEQIKRDDRLRAVASGIPVFDDLPQAATALAGFARFERFRART
jgi:acyl-CoA synthetase (NDP forming)